MGEWGYRTREEGASDHCRTPLHTYCKCVNASSAPLEEVYLANTSGVLFPELKQKCPESPVHKTIPHRVGLA